MENLKQWEKWANNSFENFKNLKNNAKIGILIEKEPQIILLNKKTNKIEITTEDSMKLQEPYPQIAFQIKKENETQITNEEYGLFKELIINDEIKIYSFASQEKLIQMGYEEFLKNLGFEIQTPTNCGCGCC